jgi:hypothetical protein
MFSKLLNTVVSVAIFLVAAAVFFEIRPQDFLRKDDEAVMYAEIQAAGAGMSFTGKKAGADVPRIAGAEEFMAQYPFDAFTAQPVNAVPTGVYELARWKSGAYAARHRTQNSPRVTTSVFWAMTGYNQYYMLELSDGTHVLALLERDLAEKLERGNTVTLPVSARAGVDFAAKPYLREVCAQYGADADNVIYAFDDAWYADNSGKLALIRVGIAAGLLIIASVLWVIAESLCKHLFGARHAEHVC